MRLGVHSEVGALRTVLVCRPGLAHLRLTPDNCRTLMFGGMLWVERAQRDHAQFVREMTARGVEVLELHELLAQTLDQPQARHWLLERLLRANMLEPGLIDDLRDALSALPSARLAELLIGGVTRADLPFKPAGLMAAYLELSDFVLPPLPNTLFPRDTSCWIGERVRLDLLHGPARRGESLLMVAIYRFHPRFVTAGCTTEWTEPDTDHHAATLEGGDVMPLGAGVVLVGVGERTSPQAAVQLAHALLDDGAATALIAAQLPRSETAIHLDTVFTQ
jgi:arginine deiminase